jgi:hypothetical protein
VCHHFLTIVFFKLGVERANDKRAADYDSSEYRSQVAVFDWNRNKFTVILIKQAGDFYRSVDTILSIPAPGHFVLGNIGKLGFKTCFKA